MTNKKKMNINSEVEREISVHIELLSDALKEKDALKKVIGLSSNLRYLVGHGKGNGWLLKKYDDQHYLVSDYFDENSALLMQRIFGVQALPQLIFPGIDIRGQQLTLEELMSAQCFYFRDNRGDINILTWDQLISLIANKYDGQHSDDIRKEFVYEAQRFQINGMTAVEFLLDLFARFILQEVVKKDVFKERNLLFDSCSYANSGKIEAIIQLRFNNPEGTPILSFDEKVPEYIV